MQGLLIANKNRQARDAVADLFKEDSYHIIKTDVVANALEEIINREIQVVVLDGEYDEDNVVKLIPLLKKCNRNISIILVTDDMPMNLVRKIRQEGIFYHALRSVTEDHHAEIKQVVRCAFKKYSEIAGNSRFNLKEGAMMPIRSLFSTLMVTLLVATPVLAVDTSVTYNSGLLILLFVGFCALLIVAQLVPALLALFGMTKTAARNFAEQKQSRVKIKAR